MVIRREINRIRTVSISIDLESEQETWIIELSSQKKSGVVLGPQKDNQETCSPMTKAKGKVCSTLLIRNALQEAHLGTELSLLEKGNIKKKKKCAYHSNPVQSLSLPPFIELFT